MQESRAQPDSRAERQLSRAREGGYEGYLHPARGAGGAVLKLVSPQGKRATRATAMLIAKLQQMNAVELARLCRRTQPMKWYGSNDRAIAESLRQVLRGEVECPYAALVAALADETTAAIPMGAWFEEPRLTNTAATVRDGATDEVKAAR